MVTIFTYQDNGPYWTVSKSSYEVASLQEMIFRVREAMESHEDVIGIYSAEGSCKGIWHRELEGYVDSAGDSIVDHEGYELLRPSTREQWMWKHLQKQLA